MDSAIVNCELSIVNLVRQFIGNFQRYFPALGKHALVVLAHAQSH